jgi:hypothetical protein
MNGGAKTPQMPQQNTLRKSTVIHSVGGVSIAFTTQASRTNNVLGVQSCHFNIQSICLEGELLNRRPLEQGVL